jgi:hypothetical protein
MSTYVDRALAGELSPMAALQPDPTHCTTKGCSDPITNAVIVGAEYAGKCFTHTREYVDRYGSEGIRNASHR